MCYVKKHWKPHPPWTVCPSGAMVTCRTELDTVSVVEAAACICGLTSASPRDAWPSPKGTPLPRLPQAAHTLWLLCAEYAGLCCRLITLVWLLQFVCNALTCCISPIWMNKNKCFCVNGSGLNHSVQDPPWWNRDSGSKGSSAGPSHLTCKTSTVHLTRSFITHKMRGS